MLPSNMTNIDNKTLLNIDTRNFEKNSANERKYKGPCPPSGTHRYIFTIYALDINGNKLSEAKLIGFYKKN